MNAVHDLGGAPGWGELHPPRPDETPFSEDWERRAFALALLSMRVSGTNLDAFRYSMSRLDRSAYFDEGYYGRWLNGAENLLLDSAIIAPGAVDARARTLRGEAVEEPAVPEPRRPDYTPSAAGSIRTIDTPPAFAVGDRVRVRDDLHPPGHTRLVGYVRGHEGVVDIVQPAQVLPDTHAHFLGENPQYV
jgi:nitrile hydratase subunit beta